MPKVKGTRKLRAHELLKLLKQGPAFISFEPPLTQDGAKQCYKIWSETWILNELVDLIPELRKQNENQNRKT